MDRRGVILVSLSALALVTCDNGPPPDELAGRKREILGSIAEQVILPMYRAFAESAVALEAATAAYAADPTIENRTAAQTAWIAAMDVWEEAELTQLGPTGRSGSTGVAGGQDLRDEIYSYPQTNSCRIDQETVEGGFRDPDAFAAELVNVRGLDAMEYLLFVESTENTCDAISPINADGSWAALGADGVTSARAEYAHTLAVLVQRLAVQLRDAWEPSGGNFVGELATAGDGSSVYSMARDALDNLAGAMIYIDPWVKDMKVGEPAGIVLCTLTCVSTVESRYAHRSKEHLIANVRAFRRIFFGVDPDGLGIDDLLVEVGSGSLATQMAGALDAVSAALAALPGTLEDALVSDPASVRTIYDALATVATLLKVDIFGVLDITPVGPPADND